VQRIDRCNGFTVDLQLDSLLDESPVDPAEIRVELLRKRRDALVLKPVAGPEKYPRPSACSREELRAGDFPDGGEAPPASSDKLIDVEDAGEDATSPPCEDLNTSTATQGAVG
jgi:hypothetical protein